MNYLRIVFVVCSCSSVKNTFNFINEQVSFLFEELNNFRDNLQVNYTVNGVFKLKMHRKRSFLGYFLLFVEVS